MSSGLPLVALLGGRSDCLEEKAVLSEVAELIFCENHEEIPERVLEEAVAVLIWVTYAFPSATLTRFKRLRLIARNGTGVDNIDLQGAAEKGIPVTNVPDYGVEEIADSTLSLILNLYRQTYVMARAVDGGKKFLGPDDIEAVAVGNRRIRGQTLGLVGLGNVATAVAQRAKAFGFHVLFYDPFTPSGVDKALGVSRVGSLEAVLSAADCISIHCPLLPATRHMINAESIKLMKPGSYVVNTARGGLVDEVAIAAALHSGHIRGAALDVHETEPFDSAKGPLAGAPRLISTPHCAYFSDAAAAEMRTKAAKEVKRAILADWKPATLRNCVNKRWLPAA